MDSLGFLSGRGASSPVDSSKIAADHQDSSPRYGFRQQLLSQINQVGAAPIEISRLIGETASLPQLSESTLLVLASLQSQFAPYVYGVIGDYAARAQRRIERQPKTT